MANINEDVEELWWEGEDMFVRTKDGQVRRYVKFVFVARGADVNVIYRCPFEED